MVRTFAGERDHYLCVAITDAAGRVLLKLSFESMTVVNVKEDVHEAHSKVDGKSVLLEKLGKARGITQVILASGDYLGEVRRTSILSYEYRPPTLNAPPAASPRRERSFQSAWDPVRSKKIFIM